MPITVSNQYTVSVGVSKPTRVFVGTLDGGKNALISVTSDVSEEDAKKQLKDFINSLIKAVSEEEDE